MPYNLVSNCVLVRETVWLRAVPTLAAEDDEVRAKVWFPKIGYHVDRVHQSGNTDLMNNSAQE
ncbi:hypothetical protein PHLCEN_2v4169 [Hermanssonia centrifuga]|uniref:Uncharacterized protein n=1 Tax=Hermanssonia centrifuga TaxID=98765 RepID=A0A2R6PZ13_9APHY|nr:hypothetical protein PHLCEN_2v4169 [Hermanssonia centrifuga]